MIAKNWDDYPLYGDASAPTSESQEVKYSASPEQSLSWDQYPEYGNAQTSTFSQDEETQRFLNLPFDEKRRVLQEMSEQRQEDVERDIGRAFIEGAIPGSSHATRFAENQGYVPASTLGEGSQMAVRGAGALVPIGAIQSGVNAATRHILPYVPGGAYIASGLTGAGYKGIHTLAEEGRLPEPTEAAKEALMFAGTHAGIDLLGRGARSAVNYFRGSPEVPPPQGPQQLAENFVAPTEGTLYQDAERAFATLRGIEARNAAANAPAPAPPGTTDQSALFRQMGQRQRPQSLQNRTITRQEGERLGVRPTGQRPATTLENRVLNTFRHESYNPTRSGEAVQQQLRQQNGYVRQNINRAYAEAEALNESFAGTREDIVNQFQQRIAEIDALGSPSTVQNVMRREMRKIINRWTRRDAEGNIIEFLDVPNQDVIRQGQALRSRLETDFMHGDASNQFIPLIEDLNNSARAVAVEAQAPEAIEALDRANQLFMDWNRTYNNDIIANIRNPGNNRPNKVYKSLLDIDTFRAARPILEQTAQGRTLVEGLQRNIADKSLSKFYENPRANIRQRQEAIRELEDVLTEEQIQGINDAFSAPEPRIQGQATRIGRQQQAEERARRTMGLDRPEQVNKLMNDVSGIRELRENLPQDQFDPLVRWKNTDILYGGHAEAQPTATEILERLTKIKNRELFIEMNGREAYDEILAASRELAAEEAAAEAAQLTAQERRQRWTYTYRRLKAGAKVLSAIGLL